MSTGSRAAARTSLLRSGTSLAPLQPCARRDELCLSVLTPRFAWLRGEAGTYLVTSAGATEASALGVSLRPAVAVGQGTAFNWERAARVSSAFRL